MRISILTVVFAISLPLSAFADEEVACSTSCPDGESVASYADGNTLSCSCVTDAEMEQTVDGEVGEISGNDD